MKNLLLVLLLFTGMVKASPPINTPSDFVTCTEYYFYGITVFDLTTKNSEILGANNPSLYTVDYFETFVDATQNSNSIATPSTYTNITANNQTVYVRVTEIANPSNFATTTLNLIVNQKPYLYNPGNYAIHDIPFDGIASFDLTTKTPNIINGQSNCTVTFFENYTDATNNVNPIATPSAYVNTTINQQGLGYRITNSVTGCYAVGALTLFVVNEPIITFSDPVLKQTLVESNSGNTYPVAYNNFSQPMSIDANGDSEIEQSEAAAVSLLNLTYHDPNNMGYHGNMHNLDGIGAFTNLTWLICGFQSLTTINSTQLANITNLQLLNVRGNNLTSLDVSSLSNLSTLYCMENQLTNLNVSGLTQLTQLYCNNNYLPSLNVTGLSSLTQLNCAYNQITSLDVAPLIPLTFLNCAGNFLTSLDVAPLVNLTELDCSNNTTITALNVSSLVNLTTLNCASNQISTLEVAPLTNLQNLLCGNNSLTTISTESLTQLANFSIPNNPITNVPITNLVNLTSFDCTNDLMTTLDVSTLVNLVQLNCGGPNLTSLLMKNGKNETLTIPNTSTNLQFICADEGQVAAIQAIAAGYATATTAVSSYCTFTPGGSYNQVTGTVRFDSDNNGCDSNDTIVPDNVRLNFTEGTVSSATFLNTTANYTLFGDIGNYILTPSLENPTYFLIDPQSVTVAYTALNNTVTNQDFCLTANGIHPDIEAVIAPVISARPGFDAVYKIVFKNKGNQTLSGNISFSYDESALDYVSASLLADIQSNGSVTWNYSNLLPFESRAISVTLNVNSPTEIPAVHIGDILNFTTTVTPVVGDEIPNDNASTFDQIVVGSFDPNAITCIEGATVSPSEIGNYLHYAINFENLGTFYAENVVVHVAIDPSKYDISTLQVMNTSHPSTTRITGNDVEFIMENINLAAAGGTPPVGGHGDVLFKIRTKDNLVVNDTVLQKAGIYFDYNAPVVTNDALTTFNSLSNTVHQCDTSVTVYPNPTETIITISSNSVIKTIELFDIQGRLLETDLEQSGTVTFDLSTKQNGVYFLKITTDKGSTVEKVVKK